MKRSLILLSCALVAMLALPALVHAFGDEIVVGFMVPLTKKGASYGVQSRAATEVAVEEINTAGGIGGRARQHLAHGLLGLGLPGQVDGGVDAQSAREQVLTALGGRLAGTVLGVVEHLALDLVDEVRRGIAI